MTTVADVSDNYSGPATFVQESGETAIDCEYRVTVAYPLGPDGPPGLQSWRGTYSVTDGGHVLEPGDAMIRLPDGREGDVIVTHVSHDMGAGRVGGRSLSRVE